MIFIIEPSALIAPLSIRKATQHKLSTDIVKHYHQVGMETLNVKGMLKNHNYRTSKDVLIAPLS